MGRSLLFLVLLKQSISTGLVVILKSVISMEIIKDNRKIFLDSSDEKSLKIILNYYLWNVVDNWDEQLSENSVISRINNLLNN